MTIILTLVCIVFVGVLMMIAWAALVVGSRDDDRAGRDFAE